MRLLLIAATVFLAGCASAPAPAPVAKPRPDLTKEAWYGEAVDQLAAMNRQAEELLKSGQSDKAAGLITQGQPIQAHILEASQPTLAAMEAASDLDQLYGRMLVGNRRYGWARLIYQKDWKRWKSWKPQTEETARRVKLAAEGLTECDRHLASGE